MNRTELTFFLSCFFSILWIAFQLLTNRIVLIKYIFAGITLSIIPITLSALIIAHQKQVTSPKWYKKWTTKIPQPFLFIFILLVAILLAPASLPVSTVPYGLVLSFILFLILGMSLKYPDQPSWWKTPMRIVYTFVTCLSFGMIIGPSLVEIFN